LDLIVIDLGGGLSTDSANENIQSVKEVNSLPMQAILKGLTAPGTWSTQPMQLGFGDLIASMTRYTMIDGVGEYTGQNLAIISEKYTNLSLRLGYHFNVIDTYISENVNDNYIYFRFVGGVTETERRHLRAILLKEILEKLNFKVTVSGDLVIARLKKRDRSYMFSILEDLGRLIGFSRQLDTQMQNRNSVKKYLNEFFKKNSIPIL
jgi:pyruvate,water dikinase